MDGKGSEAGLVRMEKMACLVLEARKANQEKTAPEELLVYLGRMVSKDRGGREVSQVEKGPLAKMV
jgi:hypothetical protein